MIFRPKSVLLKELKSFIGIKSVDQAESEFNLSSRAPLIRLESGHQQQLVTNFQFPVTDTRRSHAHYSYDSYHLL